MKRSNRRVLKAGAASLHALGAPVDGAEMSLVEIEFVDGESDFAPAVAGGEELVLVLAGEVEVRIDDATHVLAEGDAVHYRAVGARTFRARQASRILWTVLPAVTL